MARQTRSGVLIAIVVFVIIAAAVRFFGGPLYNALVTLHGGGRGGH